MGSTGGGELFTHVGFSSLGVRGVGAGSAGLGELGHLSDVDGDGRLELVAVWESRRSGQKGWLVAWQTRGTPLKFETRSVVELGSDGIGVQLATADLDNDGASEVLVSGAGGTRIARWADSGWDTLDRLDGVIVHGAWDGDGDGDPDLLASVSESRFRGLLLNDGTGRFPRRASLQAVEQASLWRGVPEACGRGRAGGFFRLFAGHEVSCIDQAGILVQHNLSLKPVQPTELLFVGDLDGNSSIDLAVTQQPSMTAGQNTWDPTQGTLSGIDFLLNDGSGGMVPRAWLDDVRPSGNLRVVDLNGDSRRDLLFVDSSVRSTALVVYLRGEEDELFLEGKYPLSGSGRGRLLIGDVDGNGSPDAVVVEPASAMGGGAFLFLNTSPSSGGTSVLTVAPVPTPNGYTLGPVYPNPFNELTKIQFSVPRGGGTVSAMVYDITGKGVRDLLSAAMPAGSHELPWDGRSDGGEELASGVYLIRLATPEGVRARKMVLVR